MRLRDGRHIYPDTENAARFGNEREAQNRARVLCAYLERTSAQEEARLASEAAQKVREEQEEARRREEEEARLAIEREN